MTNPDTTAVNQLGLHLPGLANWFNRQLTSINFKAFGADCRPAPTMHSGASEKALLELLAIRVAWDLALYRVLRDKSPLRGHFARLAASILNSAAVRDVLAGRSIVIPADTLFVAAIHDSATNRFDLPDQGKVPPAHSAVLEQTRIWLQEISRVVGAETSPSPGLFSNTLRKLLDFGNHKARTLAGRSLAGLAAFIAAPRAMTRAINFNGMVCLRSYDWQHDAGYRMLEQIMTAPLLAASCLNLQLYRAAVNNSVNNNALETAHRASQQPVRLSVLLAAPIAEIDRIIARHKKVRDLVINDWIHLFAVAPCGQKFLRRFSMAGWTLVRSGPTLAGD